MGFLYPIGGFISFVIPLFTCTEEDPDNPMLDVEYDENDRTGTGMTMDERAKLDRIEAKMNPDSTKAEKKEIELVK